MFMTYRRELLQTHPGLNEFLAKVPAQSDYPAYFSMLELGSYIPSSSQITVQPSMHQSPVKEDASMNASSKKEEN